MRRRDLLKALPFLSVAGVRAKSSRNQPEEESIDWREQTNNLMESILRYRDEFRSDGNLRIAVSEELMEHLRRCATYPGGGASQFFGYPVFVSEFLPVESDEGDIHGVVFSEPRLKTPVATFSTGQSGNTDYAWAWPAWPPCNKY